MSESPPPTSASPATSAGTGIDPDEAGLEEADKALAGHAPTSLFSPRVRRIVVLASLLVLLPGALAVAFRYRLTELPLVGVLSVPFLLSLIAVGKSRSFDPDTLAGCLLYGLGLAQLSLSFFAAVVLVLPSLTFNANIARVLFLASLFLWHRAYTRKRFAFYVVSWWMLCLVIPFAIAGVAEDRDQPREEANR